MNSMTSLEKAIYLNSLVKSTTLVQVFSDSSLNTIAGKVYRWSIDISKVKYFTGDTLAIEMPDGSTMEIDRPEASPFVQVLDKSSPTGWTFLSVLKADPPQFSWGSSSYQDYMTYLQ